MFIHEFSIQYSSITYPTGLRDERKQPFPQGVLCSINCISLASKTIIINIKLIPGYQLHVK